jgi:mRNA interferase HigB
MRIITRATLSRFVDSLAGKRDRLAVKGALDAWFSEVSRAAWQSSQDLKRSYATASIVDAERVVFNIKGNSYRLVVAVDYARQTVYVKWLGSHVEYDRIDVRTVEYDG